MSRKWIQCTALTETDEVVSTIHYFPDDAVYGISSEQAKTGIYVDAIPEPVAQEGKSATLHINPTTKEMFYVYEDLPVVPIQSEAERVAQMISSMKTLVAEGSITASQYMEITGVEYTA